MKRLRTIAHFSGHVFLGDPRFNHEENQRDWGGDCGRFSNPEGKGSRERARRGKRATEVERKILGNLTNPADAL